MTISELYKKQIIENKINVMKYRIDTRFNEITSESKVSEICRNYKINIDKSLKDRFGYSHNVSSEFGRCVEHLVSYLFDTIRANLDNCIMITSEELDHNISVLKSDILSNVDNIVEVLGYLSIGSCGSQYDNVNNIEQTYNFIARDFICNRGKELISIYNNEVEAYYNDLDNFEFQFEFP